MSYFSSHLPAVAQSRESGAIANPVRAVIHIPRVVFDPDETESTNIKNTVAVSEPQLSLPTASSTSVTADICTTPSSSLSASNNMIASSVSVVPSVSSAPVTRAAHLSLATEPQQLFQLAMARIQQQKLAAQNSVRNAYVN